MKDQTREEPGIVAAAERQMHAWVMNKELGDRAAEGHLDGLATQRQIRFLAISREAGACGAEIGRRVGERLGWDVFHRNLLDRIADRFKLPRPMLDLVDETQAGWVHDVLGTWMNHNLVPHEKFVACLTRVVLTAARRDHAVFVGRGAQFILPRHEVLAVRIVASPKFRVAQIMEKASLTKEQALRYINEIDGGRHKFVERFFHHDIDDPHLYELVINVDRCGKAMAVKQILTALG